MQAGGTVHIERWTEIADRRSERDGDQGVRVNGEGRKAEQRTKRVRRDEGGGGGGEGGDGREE